MPITKTEFHSAVEKRVDDLMHGVHAFLAAHRDQAYSETELRDGVGLSNDAASTAAFKEALRALDGLEAVRWGIVDGQDYYIYHQDL